MRRYVVPAAAMGGVAILALGLILVITLRPWGGADGGYDTHMNLLSEAPDDYSRTILSWVGAELRAPEGWRLAGPVPETEQGMALYLASACASCHGLGAGGGAVGPDLLEATASEVRRAIRDGEEGMPVFHEADLTPEDVERITAYVMELQAAVPTPAPAPAPTASPAAPAPAPTTPPATAPTASTPPAAPTPALGPSEVAIPEPTPPVAEAPGETPPASDTPAPTETPVPEPPAAPEGVSLTAAFATIAVDGDASDWADIPGATVTMQHIQRIPGKTMGDLPPIDVTLKVAVDSERVYVLVLVSDDFDFNPDDHNFSPAMAVMFRIDPPAAPHMGTEEENQRKSLGTVDIWNWVLDCGPGVVAGGGGRAGGNDPTCNLDDEYAKTPKDLEDDGSRSAENSLTGVWEHTNRAGGNGAAGEWVFELSRPLQTGDPHDAQLELGGEAAMALAYWDPDETPDGWTGLGHLQSSTGGWIEVTLPTAGP